ncbi:MAG: hypothetical protein DDT24_00811 [Chloroflexi bacterium]|nr:hypothetical protein [Chloroflexota bacterium]
MCQSGYHLLVRGTKAEFTSPPVGQGEQGFAEGQIPPGLLPHLEGLQHRQHQLLPPGGVHFLPDDLLDLPQHTPSEGQIGINARRHLVDHPCFEKKLMTYGIGFSRNLPQGLA